MRAIDYSEVLRSLGALLGVPLDQVTREEVIVWMSAINDATRYCWDWHDWADLTRVQELTEDVDHPGFVERERLEYGEVGPTLGFPSPVTDKAPKILGVFSRDPRGEATPERFGVEQRAWGSGGVYLEGRFDPMWVRYKLPFLDYFGVVLDEPNEGFGPQWLPSGSTTPGMVGYDREDFSTFDSPGNWRVLLTDPFADDPFNIRRYPYLLAAAAVRHAAANLLEAEGRPQHAAVFRRQSEERLEQALEWDMDQSGVNSRFNVKVRMA